MRTGGFISAGRGILAMALIAWMLVACDEPRLQGDQPVSLKGGGVNSGYVEYPITRTISNKEGNSLEGKILGKKGDTIVFERSTDLQIFEIPLPNLSQRDAANLAQLPDGGSEDATKASNSSRFTRNSLEKPPWGSMREALEASKESGRPVLVVVTGRVPGVSGDRVTSSVGSFERAVLKDRGFRNFTRDHVEFVYHKMGTNPDLANELRYYLGFNKSTTVATAVFSANGNRLNAWYGYDKKGPTPYLDQIKRFLGIKTSF